MAIFSIISCYKIFSSLFRRIGGQKKNTIHNKDNRPHIHADQVDFFPNDDDQAVGTLKVTGFLRGKPLDVNGLVHIPGLGDFQINQIDAAVDKYKLDTRT